MSIKKYLKPLILVVFIAVAIFAVKMTNVEQLLNKEHIESIVQSLGVFGIAFYSALYTIGTVIFLPGTPLSIIAGLLFGAFHGTIIVVLSATLGASLAFGVARYLGKDFTDKILKGRFKKIYEYDKKLEDKGFITILFLRLVPLFPFNGLNFALGLTKVRFKDFLLATLIGIIPGSFVLVNIGANATDLRSPKLFIFILLFVLLALVPVSYKGYCNVRDKRKEKVLNTKDIDKKKDENTS